jgi:hypothetical protein
VDRQISTSGVQSIPYIDQSGGVGDSKKHVAQWPLAAKYVFTSRAYFADSLMVSFSSCSPTRYVSFRPVFFCTIHF